MDNNAVKYTDYAFPASSSLQAPATTGATRYSSSSPTTSTASARRQPESRSNASHILGLILGADIAAPREDPSPARSTCRRRCCR